MKPSDRYRNYEESEQRRLIRADVRRDYVTGSLSLPELAGRFGLSAAQVEQWSCRYRWAKAREKYRALRGDPEVEAAADVAAKEWRRMAREARKADLVTRLKIAEFAARAAAVLPDGAAREAARAALRAAKEGDVIGEDHPINEEGK